MSACTLDVVTPARRASSQRRREVSSTVPDPNTRLGRQAGDALRDDGEHVDRVRHQEEDRVGRALLQGRQQLFEDAHVRVGELEPGLAGLLLRAGGDHHDVRALDHGEVVAAADARVGELRAVREVEHLGLDLLSRDVVERDLARRAADQRGVGEARPHASGADDGELRVLDDPHTPILPADAVGRSAVERASAASAECTHSHSMVPGGFDVTSSTTRFTSRTSFVMRFEIRASTS